MHCLTTLGKWAVELPQRTASLLGGSGQCNSCHALPQCVGAVGVQLCNALPYRLGVVGSGTRAVHRQTAWGQWAVQLLQSTAPLPGGSGRWNSGNTVPQCRGAVRLGTPAMRESTSWGDWESYPGCRHYIKSGTTAMHCHIALGQWRVELLSCTATVLRGSGQRVVQLLQCIASLLGGNG